MLLLSQRSKDQTCRSPAQQFMILLIGFTTEASWSCLRHKQKPLRVRLSQGTCITRMSEGVTSPAQKCDQKKKNEKEGKNSWHPNATRKRDQTHHANPQASPSGRHRLAHKKKHHRTAWCQPVTYQQAHLSTHDVTNQAKFIFCSLQPRRSPLPFILPLSATPQSTPELGSAHAAADTGFEGGFWVWGRGGLASCGPAVGQSSGAAFPRKGRPAKKNERKTSKEKKINKAKNEKIKKK